jgi:NADP-dependent 3-hydroxy acid dehydrogenase YdfG
MARQKFLVTGATGDTGTHRLITGASSGFGRDTAQTLFRAYQPVDGGLRAV